MGRKWRKLDNTAKIFSMEDYTNNNTFRLSVVLKEKINPSYLKDAVIRTLIEYPSYKVKIRVGFFWNYFEKNDNDVIIEEENEMPCESIDFMMNNDYLFKVTYFDKKINVDMCHMLTDGMGGTIFIKSILYNYLNIVKDEYGYIRKQTLTGAERFITNELKEKEPYAVNTIRKLEETALEVFDACSYL